jgi:hypothetical protein
MAPGSAVIRRECGTMNGLGLAASNPIRLLRRPSASPRRASLHPRGLDVEQKPCGSCGRHFRPLYTKQQFCSRGCSDRAKVQPLVERFWARVRKGPECWEFAGPTRKGYGQLGVGSGRHISAHRISWELANGPIPDGMQVLHTCDNPPCVNPAHLFLGTHQDNMDDMVAKGRGANARTHTA